MNVLLPFIAVLLRETRTLSLRSLSLDAAPCGSSPAIFEWTLAGAFGSRGGCGLLTSLNRIRSLLKLLPCLSGETAGGLPFRMKRKTHRTNLFKGIQKEESSTDAGLTDVWRRGSPPYHIDLKHLYSTDIDLPMFLSMLDSPLIRKGIHRARVSGQEFESPRARRRRTKERTSVAGP